MNRYSKNIAMLALSAVLLLQPGKTWAQGCAANWSPTEYKSYFNLQDEVRKHYGEVKILRVALCDQGGNAYFQIVIISGQGEVRRVQVAAAQSK